MAFSRRQAFASSRLIAAAHDVPCILVGRWQSVWDDRSEDVVGCGSGCGYIGLNREMVREHRLRCRRFITRARRLGLM